MFTSICETYFTAYATRFPVTAAVALFKRFSEENKVLERWQGPPHMNKVKKLSLRVSLFIQFIQKRQRQFKKKKKKKILSQNYKVHL